MSCSSVPPRATLRICNPRQIANTGVSASIAAAIIANSTASCSATIPYSDSSVALCPYRRGSTSPPPWNTTPSTRRSSDGMSSIRLVTGGIISGIPPARSPEGKYACPTANGLPRTPCASSDCRPTMTTSGFTRSVYARPSDQFVVDRLLLRLPCRRVFRVPLQGDDPCLGRQFDGLQLTVLRVSDRDETGAELLDPLMVHGVAVV